MDNRKPNRVVLMSKGVLSLGHAASGDSKVCLHLSYALKSAFAKKFLIGGSLQPNYQSMEAGVVACSYVLHNDACFSQLLCNGQNGFCIRYFS